MELMKKVCALLAVFLLLSATLLTTVMAAYNYGEPPTTTQYDFSKSQNYTVDATVDMIYTHGSNGFLGIGKKKSSATTKVKAVPYYYGFAISGLQSSDGTYLYDAPPTGEQVNKEFSHTQNSTNGEAIRFIRHEGYTYQMNNNTWINESYWYYNSIDLKIVRTKK